MTSPEALLRQASDREAVQDRLQSGETVQWTGRPRVFDPGLEDAAVFAFACFWTVGWVGGAGALGIKLFGFVVGLAFAVGSTVQRWWRRRGRVYAVTDRRAVVFHDGAIEEALYLRTLPGVFVRTRVVGRGSVVFDERRSRAASLFARDQSTPFAFASIEDPQTVADLVDALRARATA